MKAFEKAQQVQQAIADQWMADNAEALADFQADYVPSGTHKFETSHELYGEALESARFEEGQAMKAVNKLIVEIDRDRGFYEESDQDDDAVTAAGMFNFATMEHWKKPLVESQEFGKFVKVGSKFNPEGHEEYQERMKKKARKHGIEFCYLTNGNVRAKLKSDDQTQAEQVKRVVTLDNMLDDLGFGS